MPLFVHDCPFPESGSIVPGERAFPLLSRTEEEMSGKWGNSHVKQSNQGWIVHTVRGSGVELEEWYISCVTGEILDVGTDFVDRAAGSLAMSGIQLANEENTLKYEV